MISEQLAKAREYELQQEKGVTSLDRPAYHFSSRVGWMNDPNGFSFYKGICHLFYQYHPYSGYWGPMHWGHAVSRDFIHWEYLPAALAPDSDCDSVGCFSGSALEMPEGEQLLLYTGVRKVTSDDGVIKDIQSQCVAIGDGLNYQKQECNPVLTGKDIPAGFSEADFRDPKIWKEADGSFACVAGSRGEDGSGSILLFRSGDGLHWKFSSVLASSHNEYGKMWECPDYFTLDGEQVLLLSPQEMAAQELEFHNGNGTMCIIGRYDEKSGTLLRKAVQAIDYGIDFYATQTLLTPDGRRIMIAWMQNWDTIAYRIPDSKWFGQMTLPRELCIREGRLIQNPVRELLQYRKNKVCYRNLRIQKETGLEKVSGRVIDMVVDVRPQGETPYDSFCIKVAAGKGFYTSIEYDPKKSVLRLDRRQAGGRCDVVHERSCAVRNRNGEIRLRILLDLYSVEVFVNDGEQTMTACIYTVPEAEQVLFEAFGNVQVDVEKYDLIF